jgi:hypothetical protein
MHASGTVSFANVLYRIDVVANGWGESRGTVATNGRTAEFVDVRTGAFARADSAFWTASNYSFIPAKVAVGRWISLGGLLSLGAVRSVTRGDFSRSLAQTYQPLRATANSLGRLNVIRISGTCGDLYVTAASPARIVRFAGAASCGSPDLRRSDLNFAYPIAAPVLAAPATFLDPAHYATWPARYALKSYGTPTRDGDSLTMTANLVNNAGAPEGRSTATFVDVLDAGGGIEGSCVVDIPAAAYLEVVTVTCTANAPYQGAGHWHVEIHNAVYDD